MKKSCETDVMWAAPEQTYQELFEQKEYKKIGALTEENSDMVFSLYEKKRWKELTESVRLGRLLLAQMERRMKRTAENAAIWAAAELMGQLKLMDRIRYVKERDKRAQNRAKYCGTKHLNDVVFQLETHGALSQTELCEKLELQTSTMSEALKKIRQTGLVQVVPYGKYKLYSLTDQGVEYGASLRRKKAEDTGATSPARGKELLQSSCTRGGEFLAAMKNRLEMVNRRADMISNIESGVISNGVLKSRVYRIIFNMGMEPVMVSNMESIGGVQPMPNIECCANDTLEESAREIKNITLNSITNESQAKPDKKKEGVCRTQKWDGCYDFSNQAV